MSDKGESIGILNHCIKDNCSGCSNHFSDGRATYESYRYDTDFFTHIIAEICNYAIDNDMAPDDELSTIANNIKKLLEISSFNAWIKEGEKLKTGRCHKDTFALLKEQETKVITQEKLKQFVERPCWFESHGTYMGKEGFWIIPAMFHMFSTGTVMSYTSILNGAADCGELGLSAYNKAWRCWTSQPTDEQKMAVKWG